MLCVGDQLPTIIDVIVVGFAFCDGRRHVTHGQGVVVRWHRGGCSKMLLAGMACDFKKGGIDLLLGMFFENLCLVEFRLRVLSNLFSIAKFLLCQFDLPLRLLPRLVRKGLLCDGQP